jgi:PAS domain S-box-containing protein
VSGYGSGGRTLVRRMYHPRVVGLGLGFFCVASVFYRQPTPVLVWALLFANGFVWPHLAFSLAKTSANPYLAERRNVIIDSFLGGLWLSLMSFNMLPSATLVFMLSLDNIAVGGFRLFIKGMSAQAAGVLLSVLLFGFHYRPESNLLNVLACLPMLGLYPLQIGYVSYRLAQKLSRQKTELESVNDALRESNDRLTGAYEELREANRRYRLISENAGDVIWLWDLANNRYDYVSPSVTKLNGFTVEEAMRQTMTDALPPESLEILMTEMPRRLQALEAGDGTARAQSYEMMHYRKDGTFVPTEVMTTIITDAQGKPILIQGMTRDINSRKQVEAQLRESNAQLDLALTAARMGTWYFDLAEDRRYLDRRACDLLGIDPKTTQGTAEEFLQVLHPDDHNKVREAMGRTIEEDVPYELEYRIVTPGGIRHIATRGMLVRSEKGQPVRVNGVLWDVTEWKRTEEAMLESERKFRDLSEKSNVGIFLMQDGCFRYANAGFARIIGYEIAEIVDRLRPVDVMHPEDLPVLNKRLKMRFDGATMSNSFTYRALSKGGDVRYVETYGSVTSFRGRPAVIGTLLDVTDRRRMEAALRESEERYRSIFERATEGIYQSTPDGCFIQVNPAMARIWGYGSPAEMVAEATDIAKQHYVDPQDRERFKAAIAEHGSVEGFKVEIRRRDGVRIWVSLKARAVYDDAGNLVFYEGTNEDITEQKLMEDMIRENERRYRHLVENSNDIIYTTDLAGRITYVNPATERITGFTVSQLLGKKGLRMIREDCREEAYVFYNRQLAEGVPFTYNELPIVTRDGTEKWLGQQAQILFDGEKPAGFQMTARDITDRLKAEDEHRQRERLGAIIEMAGGVCHEMNQPLQIIYGLSDLMRMRTTEDHPFRRQIMAIKKAADRMSAITKKLTGITKYETKPYVGNVRIVDIDRSSVK